MNRTLVCTESKKEKAIQQYYRQIFPSQWVYSNFIECEGTTISPISRGFKELSVNIYMKNQETQPRSITTSLGNIKRSESCKIDEKELESQEEYQIRTNTSQKNTVPISKIVSLPESNESPMEQDELQPENESSVVFRYRYAKNQEEFKELLECCSRNPYCIKTIDIGPAYLTIPIKRMQSFLKVEELLLKPQTRVDVDLNDYDKISSIRSNCCGSEKKCCSKCWILAKVAMKTILFIVRKLYGLAEHCVKFVFSGCKGFHAYIDGIHPDKFYKVISKLNPNRHSKNCSSFSSLESDQLYQYFRNTVLIPTIGDLEDSGSYFIRYDQALADQPSHLLKLPMILHPVTLKLCCLIKNSEIGRFSPEMVPGIDPYNNNIPIRTQLETLSNFVTQNISVQHQ